jgi:hypothetical protein
MGSHVRIAAICICSKEYLAHYRILFQSLAYHAGTDVKQILYHIGPVSEPFEEKVDITEWYDAAPYEDTLTKICSLRARAVLHAFDLGYSGVLFLGAKVEFFAHPEDLVWNLDEYNAICTPHILEPLPEDGKFPSNASVCWTGHLSTDVVSFYNSKPVREFLKWQDEIMKTKCATSQHTYLDQSWLNFLPFFVPNVQILRDERYNVAYWNRTQRNLHLKKGVWQVSNGKMVCFQYSGLEKGHEEQISRHQNREIATGDFLDFLKDYTRRLCEQ